MSPEEKKELFKKLDETKKTIQQLRDSLNQIDSQKEHWFRKKEAIGKEIIALIGEAKKAKEQRNSLTDSVKKSKDERKGLITLLKEKIELLKNLRDNKEESLKKHKVLGDPRGLRREIDRLEYSLQTNVVSFEKEQRIMKSIKEMKKKYDEVKDVVVVNEQIGSLNREIKELKSKTEEKHKQVQDAAKKSQEFHENVLSSGKKIDDLKTEEEEAYKKFMEYKQQFNEVNSQLKEQLPILNDLNQKLNISKEENKKEKLQKIEETLRNKEEVVQEKLRKGQKLTTEDLLILQSRPDN